MISDDYKIRLMERRISMSVLSQYLDENRDKAYSIAAENTNYNAEGKPVIKAGDEWQDELEWDEMFESMSAEKCTKE